MSVKQKLEQDRHLNAFVSASLNVKLPHQLLAQYIVHATLVLYLVQKRR